MLAVLAILRGRSAAFPGRNPARQRTYTKSALPNLFGRVESAIPLTVEAAKYSCGAMASLPTEGQLS